MSVKLLHGDSREVIKSLADASVDSIVCDPPYHLTTGKKGGTGPASVNLESPYGRARVTTGFMGMTWDGGEVAHDPALWAECLRVLKPGGHLLAFSGTRTYHRMVCAIEDSGFEIRDQIGWTYGSGFPKSHNGEWGGTALKPAWEPIVMARKALIGTVEANWREHGTGALNIDGCRIGTSKDVPASISKHAARADGVYEGNRDGSWGNELGGNGSGHDPNTGRWPANIIHDGSAEVVAMFPDAEGQQGAVTGDEPSGKTANVYGAFDGRAVAIPRNDTGSAARFFYCAKASQEDRNEGCSGMPETVVSVWGGDEDDLSVGKKSTKPRANVHPTVKPTDLMRYLCRLVTPKGGVVLDPFMGSGSTGKAAVLEGFRFIGIDLTAEYVEIARARIDFARRQGHQPSLLEAA